MAEPLRRTTKEAHAEEAKRREINPLCMFNGTSCAGEVESYPHSATSWGVSFHTHATLCESHHKKLAANLK